MYYLLRYSRKTPSTDWHTNEVWVDSPTTLVRVLSHWQRTSLGVLRGYEFELTVEDVIHNSKVKPSTPPSLASVYAGGTHFLME